MRSKPKYTDEPLEFGGVVKDFLPPPEEIRKMGARVNVRLDLSPEVVEFFRLKAETGPRGTNYQALIRAILEEYVNKHS